MATNPMQKKSRISFLLGMVVMLIIAALVVAMLYMKIKDQQEQIQKFENSSQLVCVLNQDVRSGQILTSNMFEKKLVSKTAIPSDATISADDLFNSVRITDSNGRSINPPTAGKDYYYYSFLDERDNTTKDAIIYKQSDKAQAKSLQDGDDIYYKNPLTEQNETAKIVEYNATVAKIDMKANTILTRNAICPSGEKTTDDLRKEEYNVISLPVDLAPGDYIDVRFMLPNGQNYIVTSKKKVTIPIVNSQYLADTIQMNLTEEEILVLSCAIVENYQIEGSKLYATRYTEAGMQAAAYKTYTPNKYVITLIKNDKNILSSAIKSLSERNTKDIDNEVSKSGKEENIGTKTETSITSTLEQRKNYLLTVPAVPQQ